MNDEQRDSEREKIAKLMDRDGVPVTEQDGSKLLKYRDQVIADCNLDDEEAMMLVFETMLYRKMKNSPAYDFLNK